MHPLLQACAIVAGVVAAGMIAFGLGISVYRRLREFRDLHAGSDTVA